MKANGAKVAIITGRSSWDRPSMRRGAFRRAAGFMTGAEPIIDGGMTRKMVYAE